MRLPMQVGWGAVVFSAIGCGTAPHKGYNDSTVASRSPADSRALSELAGEDAVASLGLPGKARGALVNALETRAPNAVRSADNLAVAAAWATGQIADVQSTPQREIIYTASIDLVVSDFSRVATRVNDLMSQFGGYLGEFREDRTHGEQRAGWWVVRIPVAKFNAFLDSVGQLGVAESRQTNAQDVSEEFVDLGARLKNKKRLEERVLGLLDERSGEIKDVIAVETELGRIREEIERMEGRLRYLTNRTSLTTVTISAREDRDYQVPQAPTFTARIAHSWATSLTTLKVAGQGLTLATVAVVPWLAVATVLFGPVAVLWRRKRRPSELN